MSKQREALQLALKAIAAIELTDEIDLTVKASRAIREALAEQEQKPVAVVASQTGDPSMTMSWHHEPALPIGTKLYTAPPARNPLTDEEMRQCANAMDAEPLSEGWKELIKFARAIERAHGITE